MCINNNSINHALREHVIPCSGLPELYSLAGVHLSCSFDSGVSEDQSSIISRSSILDLLARLGGGLP